MSDERWMDGTDEPAETGTGPGDELEPRLREMARAWYNDPPETPREEVWAAVREALPTTARPRTDDDVVPLDRSRRARRKGRGAPWLGMAAAAAAVLAVGIGLGRMTAPITLPGSPGTAGAPETGALKGGGGIAGRDAPAGATMRAAAMEHLGRSETLLTLVRADARSGRYDDAVGEWGQGLLAETRLLLDSPAGQDPALRPLLEDLELILAQVAVLPDDGGAGDARTRSEMDFIARGVEERDVLGRIQALLPAGPIFQGT